jgi:hypothetical protein
VLANKNDSNEPGVNNIKANVNQAPINRAAVAARHATVPGRRASVRRRHGGIRFKLNASVVKVNGAITQGERRRAASIALWGVNFQGGLITRKACGSDGGGQFGSKTWIATMRQAASPTARAAITVMASARLRRRWFHVSEELVDNGGKFMEQI